MYDRQEGLVKRSAESVDVSWVELLGGVSAKSVKKGTASIANALASVHGRR